MSDSAPTAADTRRLAEEARARVRFEEEALELSDQVYRVARRLVGSREEAEDLVQQTYERAFRSWKQFTPGTNLRAWLLRILTNLNIDRGRRHRGATVYRAVQLVREALPLRGAPTALRARRRQRSDVRRAEGQALGAANPARRVSALALLRDGLRADNDEYLPRVKPRRL